MTTRQSRNRYCTGPDCLCTRTFYESGDHWVCEYCQKRLLKARRR